MSLDAQRRLILHMAVSLDGFVARSDGVIDSLSTRRSGCVDHGDHRHHANLEMLRQIGLVVLGRRAYEEMAPTWSSFDTEAEVAAISPDLPAVKAQHLANSTTALLTLESAEEVATCQVDPDRLTHLHDSTYS